jgi:hypothetical protein
MPESLHAMLPVEKNGGLTVAQIDLRIARNNEYTVKLWANAMDEHTKKIDERFDLHEQKDALRIEKQEIVVTSRLTAQDEKLDNILAEVKAGRAQGDDWHAQDLEYRASVQEWRATQEPKITKLVADVVIVQTQQEDLNTKFNLIHWLVMVCKGFVRTSDATIAVAERGKKITGALAAVFSFLLLVWQSFRPNGIIDSVARWLRKHF